MAVILFFHIFAVNKEKKSNALLPIPQVNERLVTNPKLLSERPDAEGYLAVILPPLRNGDGPHKRLLTAEQYWGQER